MDYQGIIQNITSKAVREISKMSNADLNAKPSQKAWSKKEILGHLIDSAFNNHQRIVRAVKQSNLIFAGYDQDEWVIRNGYQHRDIHELLQLWEFTNSHLVHAINSLPEEFPDKRFCEHNLDQIGMNPFPASQAATLAYLIWDYVHHMEGHLGQILPTYEKINDTFQMAEGLREPEAVPWLAFR